MLQITYDSGSPNFGVCCAEAADCAEEGLYAVEVILLLLIAAFYVTAIVMLAVVISLDIPFLFKLAVWFDENYHHDDELDGTLLRSPLA
mgnify:FL=1